MNKSQIKRTYTTQALLGLAIFVFIGFLFFAILLLKISRINAIETLHRDNSIIVSTQTNELKSELQKYLLVPFVLSEDPDVIQALSSEHSNTVKLLNTKLEKLSLQTGASYIFVFDTRGTTIASSNFRSSESFVGQSYNFRPYFKQAMDTGSAKYFAIGETTGKAGLFLADRISVDGIALGGVVVKVEFGEISNRWNETSAISLVTDKNGVILFSNDDALNYKTLTPLSKQVRAQINRDKQFKDEALTSAGLSIQPDFLARNEEGQDLLVDSVLIPEFDWKAYRFLPLKTAIASANLRAQLIIALIGITLAAIVFFFRRRMMREMEKAKMTEYLKMEVGRQTKELSIANEQLTHEISERELINQRFRGAREELAQANRLGSIGAITASVAHELNQPVAAIRARAENAVKLLKRGDSSRVDENLGLIIDLTARIGSISTELRRYARRGSHAITSVSLEDVMSGVQILMGDRLRLEGVNFIISKDLQSLPDVKAGRIRLEQVLVNLLQNALDALEGRSNPEIRISFRTTTEEVFITVSDNGPGISKDEAKHIFTPFFTSKSDGLGMGLGIAKDIMTDFGGAITLLPSSTDGADFELKLIRHQRRAA